MNESGIECPTDAELADFAVGRVPAARLGAIAGHLDRCERCSKRLAQGASSDPLVDRLSKFDFVEGLKSPRVSGDPFELDEDSRYELIAQLGEGGMGQVFKARHKMMKRLVALKTIRPELINHPEAVKRFAKEARAAARLSHPNIVTAFDAERSGSTHMLVMEFVQGEAISMMVNKWGPLPTDKALDYACQAAEGLQHAHEQNMVHRDIKPQNLMLSEDGVIKILDFGLSKFRRDLVSGESDSVSDESILTLQNTSMGTEGFIAPEQAADARSVDIRSDVYSLGCTLFFMLTNRPPYFGTPPDDPHAIPDLSRFRSDAPARLQEVLAKMMAPHPEDRYATPREALEAMRSIDLTAPAKGEAASAAAIQMEQQEDLLPEKSFPVWLAVLIGALILVVAVIVIQVM